MPNRCCVPGCNSNYDSFLKKSHGEGVSIFKFPKDETLKKLWLEAIQRENFVPSSTSVVCRKHFQSRDIIMYDKHLQPDGSCKPLLLRRPRLDYDVIPSIFPNSLEDKFKCRTKVPNEHEAVSEQDKMGEADNGSLKIGDIKIEKIDHLDENENSLNEMKLKAEELPNREYLSANYSKELHNIKQELEIGDTVLLDGSNLLQFSIKSNVKEEPQSPENSNYEIDEKEVEEDNGNFYPNNDSDKLNTKELPKTITQSYTPFSFLNDWCRLISAPQKDNTISNWGLLKVQDGFMLIQSVQDASVPPRTVHINDDMSIELRLAGRVATFPVFERPKNFDEIRDILKAVPCLNVCNGSDGTGNCPQVYFMRKPHSPSDRCKTCQLKHKNEHNKLKSREARLKKKQLNDSRTIKNLKQTLKRRDQKKAQEMRKMSKLVGTKDEKEFSIIRSLNSTNEEELWKKTGKGTPKQLLTTAGSAGKRVVTKTRTIKDNTKRLKKTE